MLSQLEREVFTRLSKMAFAIPDETFDAQSLTLLVNAFARAEIMDEPLFRRVSKAAMRLDVHSFDAQVMCCVCVCVCCFCSHVFLGFFLGAHTCFRCFFGCSYLFSVCACVFV